MEERCHETGGFDRPHCHLRAVWHWLPGAWLPGQRRLQQSQIAAARGSRSRCGENAAEFFQAQSFGGIVESYEPKKSLTVRSGDTVYKFNVVSTTLLIFKPDVDVIEPGAEVQVKFQGYVKQFHPGWRVVDPGSKEFTYIIEEDPSFKKFVYVNHDDWNVYRRNVSQAGPSLDNERLKDEDPELWKRISVSKVQRVRVLKDMEEISNKDLL